MVIRKKNYFKKGLNFENPKVILATILKRKKNDYDSSKKKTIKLHYKERYTAFYLSREKILYVWEKILHDEAYYI